MNSTPSRRRPLAGARPDRGNAFLVSVAMVAVIAIIAALFITRIPGLFGGHTPKYAHVAGPDTGSYFELILPDGYDPNDIEAMTASRLLTPEGQDRVAEQIRAMQAAWTEVVGNGDDDAAGEDAASREGEPSMHELAALISSVGGSVRHLAVFPVTHTLPDDPLEVPHTSAVIAVLGFLTAEERDEARRLGEQIAASESFRQTMHMADAERDGKQILMLGISWGDGELGRLTEEDFAAYVDALPTPGPDTLATSMAMRRAKEVNRGLGLFLFLHTPKIIEGELAMMGEQIEELEAAIDAEPGPDAHRAGAEYLRRDNESRLAAARERYALLRSLFDTEEMGGMGIWMGEEEMAAYQYLGDWPMLKAGMQRTSDSSMWEWLPKDAIGLSSFALLERGPQEVLATLRDQMPAVLDAVSPDWLAETDELVQAIQPLHPHLTGQCSAAMIDVSGASTVLAIGLRDRAGFLAALQEQADELFGTMSNVLVEEPDEAGGILVRAQGQCWYATEEALLFHAGAQPTLPGYLGRPIQNDAGEIVEELKGPDAIYRAYLAALEEDGSAADLSRDHVFHNLSSTATMVGAINLRRMLDHVLDANQQILQMDAASIDELAGMMADEWIGMSLQLESDAVRLKMNIGIREITSLSAAMVGPVLMMREISRSSSAWWDVEDTLRALADRIERHRALYPETPLPAKEDSLVTEAGEPTALGEALYPNGLRLRSSIAAGNLRIEFGEEGRYTIRYTAPADAPIAGTATMTQGDDPTIDRATQSDGPLRDAYAGFLREMFPSAPTSVPQTAPSDETGPSDERPAEVESNETEEE